MRNDEDLTVALDAAPKFGGAAALDGDPTVSLPVLRVSDLAGKPIPERRWIVPSLIPSRTITLLSGHGGTGKTVLVLQLLMAAALGGGWIGMPVEACPSFGLFAEDDVDELHRRIVSIAAALDIDIGQLDKLTIASRADADSLLLEAVSGGAPQMTDLFQLLLEHAKASGARVIALDPAADLFGGDEINRVHVQIFMSALRRLAIMIDGAVVLTVHPSLDGLRSKRGYSGSTAWHNSARSLLHFTRPSQDDGVSADPDVRELQHLKSNLGPLTDPRRLRWKDGAFLPEPGYGGVVGAIHQRNAENAFLEALRAATKQGRTFSAHKTAGNYGPRLAVQMIDGFTVKQLQQAMEALFRNEKIRVGVPFMQPNRHPATGLVIVDEQQE